MNTITIPQKEYRELIDTQLRYEYLRQIMTDDVFSPPPTRNRKEILKTFKETKKYNQSFLKSLEKGLQRSPHFVS